MRPHAATRLALVAWLATTTLAASVSAAEPQVKVLPGEKCPVCGMFVAKYPDWVAGVRFSNGDRAVFDGAKDLLKFLLAFEDYGEVARRKDRAALFVTDYYALRTIDARSAFYVVGGDVLGPMGRELVPFEQEADAREFLKDHRSERIIRFADVTAALLRDLDGEP